MYAPYPCLHSIYIFFCMTCSLSEPLLHQKIGTDTMYSWALLRRKSPPLIHRIVTSQLISTRPASTQTNRHQPSPSSPPFFALRLFCGSTHDGNNEGNQSFLQGLLKYVSSAVVVAGSGVGFCYWSFLCDRDSFVCYADTGSNSTETRTKPRFLFKDEYRRKVFFKYEKRIRTQSPPEKVFEYFASIQSPTGELFMTPGDLMRAVVPVFPPSEAGHVRAGYLKGELVSSELQCAPSEFFMLFDTNNDGLISFAEQIDKEEFKKVMALMRTHNRQGASHRDGLRYGLKISRSVENAGLLECFFGKDGKECLEHGKFVQFLRDLHDEMLWLEFAHYDFKSEGTISAKDFALSMVASADIRHINKFLDCVDEVNNEPRLRDIRITFEEFRNFSELRKRLQPLSLAIFSYGKVNGLLTRQDFQRAAYQVCGISLTDNVVDIIFHLFDTNLDGSLSSDEFLRVLQGREMDISQPRQAGFRGLISCWLECTKNCSSGISCLT